MSSFNENSADASRAVVACPQARSEGLCQQHVNRSTIIRLCKAKGYHADYIKHVLNSSPYCEHRDCLARESRLLERQE